MPKDIIIKENELSMATNSIKLYIEFLVTSINEYIKILKEVQEIGIEDNLIRAELAVLASEVEECTQALNTCGNDIAIYINQGVEAIAKQDDFEFPEAEFSLVEALIKQLI